MTDKLHETVGPTGTGGAELGNEAGRALLKGGAPDFASDDAAEAWIAAGRPALPRRGSGKGGTITKADVKTAAEKEA